jgi:hypothetical protein
MMINKLASYLGGFFASTTLASPVEWAVHRYMLHPKSRNLINTRSAISHNDRHHGAYSGPEHYYRDMSNAHEKIHFSKKWVAIIHTVSAGVGIGVYEGLTKIPALQSGYEGEQNAFVGGFITGIGLYYAAYEILHHNMHVIGARRHGINTVFGNRLQEVPDGKLRFSKPTLDDLCDHVEMRIDSGKNTRNRPLIEQLEQEHLYNLTEGHHERVGGKASLKKIRTEEALEQTVEEMRGKEHEYRSSLNFFGRTKYTVARFLHHQMRTSPAFQHIDNHHFVHHFQYYKNLNVVLPVADIILGTEIACSKEDLRKGKMYWICPNSPDAEKFVLENELAKQQEMLAGQQK